MQQNYEYENEISLKDLFFHVLYHWRSIVVITVICAILAGGYAFLKNRNIKSTGIKAENTSETASGPLKDNYSVSNEIYARLLEENRDYSKNSIFMRINPRGEWKAVALYTVVMDDTNADEKMILYDPAIQVAAAYPSVILNTLDEQALKTICGNADINYIYELISSEAIENSNTFRISVIGTTEEMVQEVLNCIDQTFREKSQDCVAGYGPHHIIEISKTVKQITDTDAESRQASVAKNIATYQKAITDNETASKKAPAESGGSGKKSVKKYILIGILIGLALSAGFWMVAYAVSGKLRDPDYLRARFGLPLYGAIRHSRARHPGKGIDGLIEKWEFHKQIEDPDITYENISALIREQIQTGTLLLTGTIQNEKLNTVETKLTEKLKEGFILKAEGSFRINSRAITEAGKADAVIIVEEKDVSHIDAIDNMAEKLMISQANVIGSIII